VYIRQNINDYLVSFFASASRDHGCMIRCVSKQVNMIENDGGLVGMTLPIYKINDIE